MFTADEYTKHFPNRNTILHTLGSQQAHHGYRSSLVIIAKRLKDSWYPVATDYKPREMGPATVEIGSLDLEPCPIDAVSYGYDDDGFVDGERAAVLTLGDSTVNVFGQDFVVGLQRGIAVLLIDQRRCAISVIFYMPHASSLCVFIVCVSIKLT